MIIPSSDNPVGTLKGVLIEIMTALSVDEAISRILSVSPGITKHTFYLRANAAVAGVGLTGSLTIESNSDWSSVGDWAPKGIAIDLATIVVPAATTDGEIMVEFIGVYNALRCRINTVVAGGTLSVRYIGTSN